MSTQNPLSWFVLCGLLIFVCCPFEKTNSKTNLSSVEFQGTNCPYNCSGHGECNEGQCRCFLGWGGDYCEYVLNELPIGTEQNGTVSGPDSWELFHTNISPGFNLLEVTVVRTKFNNSAGWPKIYARWQFYPTSINYDFASTSDSLITRTLQIMMPNPGQWYFGVTANQSCEFLISVALYVQCPNDCSFHGSCDNVTGNCYCWPAYNSNDDCSQEILTLLVNQPISDVSNKGRFNYYNVFVQNGNQLSILFSKFQSATESETEKTWVNFPTASHELFVSSHTFPNLTSYEYTAKVNHNNQIQLVIPLLKHGTWFIGIWGHSTFSYNLTVQTSTSCPNDCNGHGICDQSSGVCHCDPYWTQQDCSLYIRELDVSNSSLSVVENITTNQWHYYPIQINTKSSRLLFTIQVLYIPSPNIPTLSLYLQRNVIPTVNSYSHLVTCQNTTCTLEVDEVSTASYKLGIVVTEPPNTQLTFNLSVVADQPCPNQCSNAGQCVGGTCVCKSYYQLSDCSIYLEPLSLHTKSYNRIHAGEWKFYSINITSVTYLSFEINSTSTNETLASSSASVLSPQQSQDIAGYCLYLQYGTYPTSISYLKKTTTNQTYQQLLLQGSENIQPGIYYLGVFGLSNTSSYWVRVKADRICPRNCSGNGQCINDQCVCDPPYIPDDCSNQDLPISEGVEMTGVISFDRWDYYHISMMSNDALEVIVQEDRSNQVSGLIWVFVKRDTRPTIDSNDFRNQSDTTMHSIWIPSTKAKGYWSIGVTGSPRNHGVLQARYSILILSGCATYSSCGPCVADPACGWCRNDPEHPKGGICTPGDRDHSFTSNCLLYSFDSCDITYIQTQASLQGFIGGILIGILMILVIVISGTLIWRHHYLKMKQRMRPADLSLLATPQKSETNTNTNVIQSDSTQQINKEVLQPERKSQILNYGTILPQETTTMTGSYLSFGGIDVYTDSEDEKASSSSDNEDSKPLT